MVGYRCTHIIVKLLKISIFSTHDRLRSVNRRGRSDFNKKFECVCKVVFSSQSRHKAGSSCQSQQLNVGMLLFSVSSSHFSGHAPASSRLWRDGRKARAYKAREKQYKRECRKSKSCTESCFFLQLQFSD